LQQTKGPAILSILQRPTTVAAATLWQTANSLLARLPPFRFYVAKLHHRGSSSLCKLVSEFIAGSGHWTTDYRLPTADYRLQTPGSESRCCSSGNKSALSAWDRSQSWGKRQRSLLKISICCHCVQQFAIVKLYLMINVCGGHIKFQKNAVCLGHLRDLCGHEWHQCLRLGLIQLHAAVPSNRPLILVETLHARFPNRQTGGKFSSACPNGRPPLLKKMGSIKDITLLSHFSRGFLFNRTVQGLTLASWLKTRWSLCGCYC